MRNKWLAIAGIVVVLSALLVVAALLSEDPQEPEDTLAEEIVYPRDLPDGPKRPRVTKDEQESDEKPEKPDLELPTNLPGLAVEKGTAVQRAVSAPGKGALVFELGAIAHSDLARRMLKCRGDRVSQQMARFEETTGINPLEDMEQLGVADGVLALGGRLSKLVMPAELGKPTRYGDAGSIYKVPSKKPGGRPLFVGRVGNGLLVAGNTEDEIKHAMDRAEGRAPAAVAEAGYADVRGEITSEELLQMLGDRKQDEPELQAVRELARGVKLRMNVDDKVAVSMDVGAEGEDNAADLSAALKSAVGIARQMARKEGAKRTAWLLDRARFGDANDEGFALDVAVPGGFILKAMGCDEDGNKLPQGATPTH